MGLSAEDRVLGAYRALVAIHKEVDTTTWTTWRGSKPFVRKIQGSCEQLIGILIGALDTNSAYWIAGEYEGGFRALILGYEFRAEAGFTSRLLGSSDSKAPMSLDLFATHMGFSAPTRQLASWWSLWKLVPALLYPVHRHRDGGFTAEFRREMRRLIAHIMLLRQSFSDSDEGVMLWKYELFLADPRKWDEKVKWLRAMPQKTLESEVRARNDKRYAEQRERDANAHDKPRVDPAHGDVPSEDALIARVCEATGCDEPDAIEKLYRYDGDAEAAIARIRQIAKDAVKRGKTSKRVRSKRAVQPPRRRGKRG